MYEKTVLGNGLRVVSSSMPNTRAVSICLFIGAGSRHERSEEGGLSHFTEHLCFKGTERRPTARQISETIDSVGGILNGEIGKELTVYWVKVARTHFGVALDLISDIVRNSRFDPREVESERQVIIQELSMCLDSPQSRVDMLIDELMWPDQPLGRDVVGSKETVGAITRDMIVDYLSRHYLPSTTVIGIAGDIGHEEVVDSVARALGDWPDSVAASWVAVNDCQDGSRVLVEERSTEQTNVCLGMRGMAHLHPDRFILDLLNLVLGEGMSSRLFLEVRERRGLAYDVQSQVSHFHDTGSINISAGVDPGRVEDTVKAILEELGKLRDTQVSEEEMAKAKEMGKGRLMLRMEDSRSVAGWVGAQELLTGDILTIDAVNSILEGITAADLQRVARELFVADRLCLALVGPHCSEENVQKLLKL